MSSGIETWLESLGFGEYADAFVENEVDLELLRELTNDDLKDLGIAKLRHRKALLAAIADLEPSGDEDRKASGPTGGVAHASDAERRRLTVMFVDLVGSTEISSRLDPEDLRRLIIAYQKTVAGAVARFEGHVAKYMGDGVLCYFGWPKAHEDDAERAIRAALSLLQDLEAPEGVEASRLEARVGIATGLVVVGDLVGHGSAQEEAVVGETPNIAARLQGAAEPGAILISTTTRALVGRVFELEPTPSLHLKGMEGPTTAFRVLRESVAESRYGGRGGPVEPTIGRDAETALLADRWRRAAAGEGQAVLLRGDAGIGKSALLFEFRRSLEGEPHAALVYSTSPHHSASALWPVVSQLGRAARLDSADPPATRGAKLEALLQRSGVDDPLDASVICELAGASAPDPDGLATLSPRQRKSRAFRTLRTMLEALCGESPVLILLEDLHWIDPTSAELFEEIVVQLRRLPAMLVATTRPEAPEPAWARLSHVTALSLGRLSSADAERLAERAAAGRPLPPDLLRAILERTEGVPLFVEEMTKNLLEDVAGRGRETIVPATLHDSLMSRLDRLGEARRVAQVAACIGRDVDEALLVEAFEGPPSEVARGIDALIDSELAFRVGSDDARRLRFKHALIRDVAYASLLKERRRDIHGRVADRLAARGEAVEPEVLARHLEQAGRRREAAEAWRRASEYAFARSAMHEARAHLEAAVALLREAPEDAATARLELDLLGPLGVALTNTRGPAAPEAEAAHRRAAELAARLQDAEADFRARWAIWRVANAGGRHARSKTLADDLLRRAEADGDADRRMQAHHAAWSSGLFRGAIQDTRRHVEDALAIYDPDRHAGGAMQFGGHDARECGLTCGGYALYVSGLPEEGLASNLAGIRHADAIGKPQIQAHAYNWTLLALQSAGDLDEMERRGRRLQDLVAEHGLEIYATEARMVLSWLAARRERDPAHVEALLGSLERRTAMGTSFVGTYFRHLVADAWLALGREREAAEAIEMAIEDARRRGEMLWYAELLRLRARIGLALGDRAREEIVGDLRAAAEDAESRGALIWRLRVATDLARLFAESGERSRAHDDLAAVVARFDERSGSPDVAAARALLDSLR